MNYRAGGGRPGSGGYYSAAGSDPSLGLRHAGHGGHAEKVVMTPVTPDTAQHTWSLVPPPGTILRYRQLVITGTWTALSLVTAWPEYTDTGL